jgi:hypothetical protein
VPPKGIILLLEAAVTLAVWWTVQPEHERRMMVAGAWKAAERVSMLVAKHAATLATKAEANYKETVAS